MSDMPVDRTRRRLIRPGWADPQGPVRLPHLGPAALPLLLILAGLTTAGCAGTPAPSAGQPVEAADQTGADSGDPGGDDSSGAGYAPQPGTALQDLTRSDAQGAVEFTVVPTAWTADAAGTLEFQISMNTHSVDLSMDLAKLATLETDTGITLQALDWSGGSGHHVEGLLRFPAATPEGQALLQDASQLILTIRDVDAAARVFEWDVALLP